ncbi:mRNA-binding protein RRP12 NDAI_0C06170 [Naumovozyma dairenensis CBS 421]|uniref:Uncharacterized protein n=1 Tax=Naumovozyma dairenensis (strain ATCC 10597 / BCRC 20456 / CBS 421 / NBRC 0211 / NRRL Y-12639) TaxID=1071378 RepID=G0W915_NAUDC|nr:hypothetical protein NDAI_0C06170 [Naumovozyma dairenensis CBS 421]CCD24276.1 hypothetical protein NDAI_0C06170 [Naumovozyma dairenensis CBS 421]
MDQEQVAFLLELEDKLSKIRSQIDSKLDNQKHIAIILSAVEENIQDQESNDISKNLVNYLVSFMSLLDQSMDPETHSINDLQLATSSTYLLDIIFHYSPKTLLRSKFSDILTKVAPCITDEKSAAPLIRSAIGCLESLLIAQDAQAWNNTHNLTITPKRGLQGLLELSLDPRPKVRKRALEAINNILSHPPAAPTAEHVAANGIADFAVKSLNDNLNELSNISNKKLKSNNNELAEEINNKIIRSLRLIGAIIASGQWPIAQIESLCDILLGVTRSSEQYLVSAAFQCFENLFKSMAETSSISGLAESNFLKVIDTIFTLKPSNTDSHLAGAWIAVVAKGMATYSVHQPLKCLSKIPEVFKVLSVYLKSETPEVYVSASQCLMALLTESVQDNLLLYPPATDEKTFETVNRVIVEISDLLTTFLSIKYTHCAKEILNTVAVAFKKFRYRSTPALLAPLKIVDKWRCNEENFLEFSNEAENVIGEAISAIGPEAVLELLPLNLIDPSDSQPGRAWLLPILRDYTKNAKLETFIKDISPLITSFESKFESLPKESVQLRIFQTVVDQLWSTLPHFCELPIDLRESFTDEFASELSSLLYTKVDLRTTLCHSLKVLVESNCLYANGALSDDVLIQQRFPASEAKKNVEYLQTKSVNLLSVLFNVYTQTSPDSRGYILETIEAYLQITSESDLEMTFNNVCGLLKNAMNEESNNEHQSEKPKTQLTATLLDLIVCMAKYIPSNSYNALFAIFGTTSSSKDALVQKRAYRIITKLSELPTGSLAVSSYISDIEKIMIDSAETVQTSAKSVRFSAIKTIVELLPLDHLSFIVRIVAEIILGTKDVNEKSRDMAFETLICMGKKMDEPNGVIKLATIPGYDESLPDQPSSISEFFKIISAGLIGESQHMVSSTITAYACLVFEFKDELNAEVLMEIYDTVELYLTSNSREIVKSAIGFVKVCILGLSDELMRPKVPELLPKLLRWSHEHSGHFKAKVKHLIERLIRRFGYEYVEANFPEEDQKLLTNIRKTRNRNKRKGENDDADVIAGSSSSSKASKFMTAFDEAIYGSDEEGEASDNEHGQGQRNRKKKGSKQFIVESGENPLDLLDSETLAHISSSMPKKLNKNQKKKLLKDEAFSFDSEGKLIMKGNKNTSEDNDDPLKSVTNGINAYLEAVENGPVRGQKNKLKFKKNSKNDDGFSDDEGDGKSSTRRNISTKNNKIGKNFKKNSKFKSRRKL